MTSKNWRVRAVMPFAFALLALPRPRRIRASTRPRSASRATISRKPAVAGDWDPACPATQLSYDANGDIWRNTFSITPAGAYEYKVALNGSWDVNYGLHAQQNGPNIPLATTSSPQSVTFYYDHKTHWVTENVSSIIATVPGSFQSEIGCSGDWDPGCFRSWLQDIQGTGIYSFSTSAIPAGSYEAKVALNGNWDVNYGAGGVQNGPNIAFTVPANDMEVDVSVELHDQGSESHCRRHPGRSHQGAGVLAVGRHHRLERAHRYRRLAVRGSGRRAHARWPRHRRCGRIRNPGRSRTIRRACRAALQREISHTSRTWRHSSCRPRRSPRPPRA